MQYSKEVILDTNIVRYLLYGNDDQKKKYESIFCEMDKRQYGYSFTDFTMCELLSFLDNSKSTLENSKSNNKYQEELKQLAAFIRDNKIRLSFIGKDISDCFYSLGDKNNIDTVKTVVFESFAKSLSTLLAEVLRITIVCLSSALYKSDTKLYQELYHEILSGISSEEAFTYYYDFCYEKVLDSLSNKNMLIKDTIEYLFKYLILRLVARFYTFGDSKFDEETIFKGLCVKYSADKYDVIIKELNRKADINVQKFVGNCNISEYERIFILKQVDFVVNRRRQIHYNDFIDFINVKRSIEHKCDYYLSSDKPLFTNIINIFDGEADVIDFINESRKKCFELEILK